MRPAAALGISITVFHQAAIYPAPTNGQLSFASSGTGALIHLTGELFKQMAGVDILHVPYKGTTQLLLKNN